MIGSNLRNSVGSPERKEIIVSTAKQVKQVKLDRAGVREILVQWIMDRQRLREDEITDATIISEPDVLIMLYARLYHGEHANVKESTLAWKRGWTVGAVLDALGLENGDEIARTRAQTNWSRT